MDILSTPVLAKCKIFFSFIFPEASSKALPLFRFTDFLQSSIEKLSKSIFSRRKPSKKNKKKTKKKTKEALKKQLKFIKKELGKLSKRKKRRTNKKTPKKKRSKSKSKSKSKSLINEIWTN